MREIRFRVWCHNKNEWEKDYMAISQSGQLIDVLKNKPVKHDTHTIQMFTGLHDKSAIEIYEGDIIKIKGISVVTSIQDIHQSIGFRDKTENETYSDPQKTIYNFEKICQVIGNIWENPELLEAK